jgi:hypothetical protein
VPTKTWPDKKVPLNEASEEIAQLISCFSGTTEA